MDICRAQKTVMEVAPIRQSVQAKFSTSSKGCLLQNLVGCFKQAIFGLVSLTFPHSLQVTLQNSFRVVYVLHLQKWNLLNLATVTFLSYRYSTVTFIFSLPLLLSLKCSFSCFFFLSNLLKTLQDALILICSKFSLLLLKRLPRVSVNHYLRFNLSLSIIVFRMIIVFQLNWEGYIKMGCTTVI